MALSAKEAAIELGTDARTFRKFMRSITPKENQPGQGNRYQIDDAEIKKLKKRFADWSAPKVSEAPKNGDKPSTTKKKTKKAKDAEAIDITEVDPDMIEDLAEESGPTEAELLALEDIDLLDEDIFDLD